MRFNELARHIRMNHSPYSQQELAVIVGTTQSNMSKYELGEYPIPDDIAQRMIKELKSLRLKVAYKMEKQASIISMPLLNNVDENPTVLLDVLVEEAKEMIASALVLKKLIRNKKSRDQFTDSEWQQVLKCEEQIADLSPALDLHFVVMHEIFDLDSNQLSLIIQEKCKSKNYYF